MDEEFKNKIKKVFKNIDVFNKEYPTDSELVELMTKSREEFINTLENDSHCEEESIEWFKANIYVSPNLKLPEIFRTGIFKNHFVFGHDKLQDDNDYYACAFNCKPDPEHWVMEIAETDFDVVAEAFQTRTIDKKRHRCTNCKSRADWFCVDTFMGFDREFDNYTDYCDACYNLDLGVTNKNVNGIILDYLRPVFKLKKSKSSSVTTVATSQLYDWLPFIYLALEEDSLYYAVNCNPDSKFYGYVLLYGHQGEFELVGHVDQFNDPDFFVSVFNRRELQYFWKEN
jgi:hypothetical protein